MLELSFPINPLIDHFNTFLRIKGYFSLEVSRLLDEEERPSHRGAAFKLVYRPLKDKAAAGLCLIIILNISSH